MEEIERIKKEAYEQAVADIKEQDRLQKESEAA